MYIVVMDLGSSNSSSGGGFSNWANFLSGTIMFDSTIINHNLCVIRKMIKVMISNAGSCQKQFGQQSRKYKMS